MIPSRDPSVPHPGMRFYGGGWRSAEAIERSRERQRDYDRMHRKENREYQRDYDRMYGNLFHSLRRGA